MFIFANYNANLKQSKLLAFEIVLNLLCNLQI